MKALTYCALISILSFFSFTLNAQDSPEEIFKIVERMPFFGDCGDIEDKTERKQCSDKSIIAHIGNNIDYPEAARKNNTEGMVVIRFVIEKDGSLTDAKILKGIGDGCDEEALRVVELMEKWTPGETGGEKVRVQFTLPIRYKLQEPIPEPDVKAEKFEQLGDLFCENYLGEFISADKLNLFATQDITRDNVCGIKGEAVVSYFNKLTMKVTRSGMEKSISSEDGIFSESMKEMMKNLNPGDTIEFEYTLSVTLDGEHGSTQDYYRTIIVE